MILCSECYLQVNGKTLMLYRNKKENDINEGKHIGIGGRFEFGESPEECMIREVREEVGVIVTSFRYRGMVTFVVKDGDSEPIYIFFFIADGFEGEIKACDEGELVWIETDRIEELNLWEGDRLLWKWLRADEGLFSGKFVYDGDILVDYQVRFY